MKRNNEYSRRLGKGDTQKTLIHSHRERQRRLRRHNVEME